MRPSTIRASEMAYCSLRRKPFVPSIGSRVQNRGTYSFWDARSIQAQASLPHVSMPTPRSSARIRSRNGAFSPRERVDDSSSPMIRSPGKAAAIARADHRLAGKVGHRHGAAIVLLEDVGRDLRLHALAHAAADRTASRATLSSFSNPPGIRNCLVPRSKWAARRPAHRNTEYSGRTNECRSVTAFVTSNADTPAAAARRARPCGRYGRPLR